MENTLLESVIEYAIQKSASDIHLCTDQQPTLRISGTLSAITDSKPITGSQVLEMIESIMSEKQKAAYKKDLEIDFSINTKFDNHRFRVNAFNTVRGPSATLRIIPSKIISLADIHAPLALSKLCKSPQGLILLVGPTGSGKSTTLAAMINHINDHYRQHIITIEDPVEFVYKNNLSLINQREVGTSTNSFAIALKSALREDPDVIMVGEMRDLETIRLALTAAETGHLVFATLHTNSASKSINRIIDVFPPAEKNFVRSLLASSIKAIISQRLVEKVGGGRAPVYEVMIVNSAIRNLILEDKIPQISSMIEISKNQGMVTIKDSILDLFEKKIISQETFERLMLIYSSK